ncbi:MAG: dipeptide epimerase [Ignavibacteriales bacterium]|nr:dipeptide epimerase [Ignavibacteriales bacterium]
METMQLSFSRFDLKLKHTFTISRSSRDVATVVFVGLELDGITGIGEAAPSRRYGETIETVEEFFGKIDLAKFQDPFQLENILRYVDSLAEGNYAAKAAIDLALHDWIGKKLNVPLYKYWGLDKTKTPLTSFTIGIDSPDVIEKKIHEAEEYPILKIKLGGSNDKEIMQAIRNVTKKTLRVDANEGWKTKEVAVEKIKWLEQEGVEFVEQPMPAEDLAGTSWVRERVNLPLIADENSIRLHDVPKLQGAFDGINIKLMKCTGLREGMQMVHTARACGLKIMAGCMIESSVAISAAAQFSPLIDYADLDGHVLTSNDPYDGVTIVQGKLILPDRPGIGAVKRD